jgi:succinate dehydrogenase flavin-adding protein (antitoxin of CptAB toxin-antitoxin module)
MYIHRQRKGATLNGEKYYMAAIALTDANPGVTFKEAISHDARVSQVERLYFTGEWRDLDLYGWNTFSMKMEQAEQKKWLAKIKELDGNVVLDHLESQLMQASRDGKAPNRALLEATVKALQGVVALNKVTSDIESGGLIDGLEIKFIPSLDRPVEAEEWERILAEKNPDLAEYFGLDKTKPEQTDTVAEPVTKSQGKDGE